MRIAAFLDVDKTLTREFIQKVYAVALGCEPEYSDIENAFGQGTINAAVFGNRLIQLFASRGFTYDMATEIANKVELQPWTSRLLDSDVDVYLVSSGPNYYIDTIAKKYGIAPERLCRSIYSFDPESRIINSCDPVGPQEKAKFVEDKSKNYDITIGIGDDPRFDGQFLAHCTIPFLTVTTNDYIYIPNINSAVVLIDKLAEQAKNITIAQAKEIVQRPKKVVVPLHGIRTIAAWHRKLAEVLQIRNWFCPVDRWNFGRFSLLRFLLPWSRNKKILWFRETYNELMENKTYSLGETNRPSIVAHSFGAYIVGNALLRYETIRFDKIILCGSILPEDFAWNKIIDRGQVVAVRNEYGTKDTWASLVRWFVRDTGASGQTGFVVKHPKLFQQQFFFDHSEYFDEGHMQEYWVGFLAQD